MIFAKPHDMLHLKAETMEDFHTVESCVFNLETDLDRAFYDSDTDKEFHEKHSLDLWAKCKCNKNREIHSLDLLTPPTSPQHDPFSESCTLFTNDLLNEAISNVDDETLTQTYLAAELFADTHLNTDSLNANLIQDCMWSGPGLSAAGFKIPSIQKKKSQPVDENCNTIVDKKSNLDIKRTDCVDPAAVFPVNSRITLPTPSPVLSSPVDSPEEWIAGLDTPSASESDDEEIDVVGVVDKSGRHHKHSPALNSSIKSRPMIQVVNSGSALSTLVSTNLPATSSMSAQVAALHNYSSTTHSAKSHSCLKTSTSAPQTPSSNGHLHHSLKRSRPFSSPASPSSCKKQKLHDKNRFIVNEKDLHSVVRRLNHSGRKHKPHTDAHSYSRSSSDNEDLSETGKRAYHNVLERKRRDDLRLSFHMLRAVVPEIRDNERAPKMVILNQSTEYAMELTRQNQALNNEQQKLKLYQEQLKKKKVPTATLR